MSRHVALFANFTCKFGDRNMLDYAKEIVLPAFTDDTLIRKYKSSRRETKFFFYETEIISLSSDEQHPVVGVIGRFVKDTELVSEQIFDEEKGIVPKFDSIPSAPSSFFLLILNNHRLIYLPETSGAPSLQTLQSTLSMFLRKKRMSYIDMEYLNRKETSQRISKKDLSDIIPQPALDIIPIAGNEEIDAFVGRFGKLRKIEFQIIKPNDEIDGGDLVDDIRKFLDPIKPESTKLETSSKEGLDAAAALPRIKQAASSGLQRIKLSGTDIEGNSLRGDNHTFQVTSPIIGLPNNKVGIATKLYEAFNALRKSGVITIDNQDSENHKILNHLLKDT